MKMTYREALREGLRDALRNDARTILVGEDVGAYGGTYAVSKGLLSEFGPLRVRDSPLSEASMVGLGIGAALGGLRPIIEIMTVNFCLLALDQIVNSGAFYSHMSGGQLSVPLVIRMTTGAGRQLAAQHSNSFEGWLAHIPGLVVLTPSTVQDARTTLSYALKEQNPVLIFEHALLLNQVGDYDPSLAQKAPFTTQVCRTGERLTVVTYGGTLFKVLSAAENIDANFKLIEVLDLRILRPLDMAPVYQSVRKTHRLLIVDEGWRSGSISAELSSRVQENCFYDLDRPIQRLAKMEVPVPYSKHLEEACVPSVASIEDKIREMLK